jgi:hypothetical protein
MPMRSNGSAHSRLLPSFCLVSVLSVAFCLGCGQSSERTAELSEEARWQVIQKKVDVKHRAALRPTVKDSSTGRDRTR